MLRVRCSQRACGFVNVIPADPNLAPWEARGAVNLLVVDDREGAVLLAPPVRRTRPHRLLITLGSLLVVLGILANPAVRRAIVVQCAVHEIATTNAAGTAERWCQWLQEIGPPARSAAPIVWDLHHRTFAGGFALKESFINSVLDAIDPSYLSSRRPKLTRDSSITELIAALKFPDVEIRKTAADLLGEPGAGARDAVGALTDVAERPQDNARTQAIEALGRIGPDAAPAVPALIRLLNASGTIREAAARALLEIAPQDPRVLTAIDSPGIPAPVTQPGGR